MKRLLMITNHFPYGNLTGEIYLRKELETLARVFDKVTIFACDAYPGEYCYMTALPANIEVFALAKSSKNRHAVLLSPTISQFFKKHESEVTKEKKTLDLKQQCFLYYFIAKAEQRMKKIRGVVETNGITDIAAIYSCRFFDLSYIAVKLKEGFFPDARVVTRAHRYDLYEEQNPLGYLPLRSYLLCHLDLVLPCSRDGEKYLVQKHPLYTDKIRCSYIGSADYGIEQYHEHEGLNIVSCSNVNGVKRVDRIAAVIQCIANIMTVHWTHMGGGPGMDKLRKQYKEEVDSGRFTFCGKTDHDAVISCYRNNTFDYFINLSTSEGIPLAIMEAISFGVPAVATNVGGNSEIVLDGVSGMLVEKDEPVEQIAARVIALFHSTDRMTLRDSARAYWKDSFDTSKNAGEFADLLYDGVDSLHQLQA